MPIELPAQRGDQIAVLPVDRADAAELIVMRSDFQDPLAGHPATAQDIFEERQDVARTFRAAKGNDDNRIVIVIHN